MKRGIRAPDSNPTARAFLSTFFCVCSLLGEGGYAQPGRGPTTFEYEICTMVKKCM